MRWFRLDVNNINPNNHDMSPPLFRACRTLCHLHLRTRPRSPFKPPLSPTLCIRLRSAEPESKTSLFVSSCPFLFQKLHTHISPSLHFPLFLGHHLHLFSFHIALQERAILCFYSNLSHCIVGISLPPNPPHHNIFTSHVLSSFVCFYTSSRQSYLAARPRALRLCIHTSNS